MGGLCTPQRLCWKSEQRCRSHHWQIDRSLPLHLPSPSPSRLTHSPTCSPELEDSRLRDPTVSMSLPLNISPSCSSGLSQQGVRRQRSLRRPPPKALSQVAVTSTYRKPPRAVTDWRRFREKSDWLKVYPITFRVDFCIFCGLFLSFLPPRLWPKLKAEVFQCFQRSQCSKLEETRTCNLQHADVMFRPLARTFLLWG